MDTICSHYKRIYLYSYEVEPYTPTVAQVSDAHVTCEKWVLKPTIMHLEDVLNVIISPSEGNMYLMYHIQGKYHKFNLKTMNLFKFYGSDLDKRLYKNVEWRVE